MDKIKLIFDYLRSLYESSFFDRGSDPFFVLIFTMLSQRTRDGNTEKVTAELFRHYDTPEKLAEAPIEHVMEIIKPCGFYRMKAPRIIKAAKVILERFGGKVPETREELLSLEGVGPKTAACTLVYGFRKPAVPVDTHVHRISNRLGLVDTNTPEETERELEKVLPKEHWIEINEYMVKFGQNQCLPRRPKCSRCKLIGICRFYLENKNTKLVS